MPRTDASEPETDQDFEGGYLHNLVQQLAVDPNRVIITDADTGRTLTAQQFSDLIAGLAAALDSTGEVARGSVVAIIAPISVEALAVRYAAGLLGCVTVYCPDAANPRRLSKFLDTIDAHLLIVFPETAAALDGVSAPQTVSVGAVPGLPVDLLAVALTMRARPLPHLAARNASDPCVLVATGGTTGVSKATRRDEGTYAALVCLGSTPHRRQLICTPMAYITQTLTDTVLIGGGELVLRSGFEPEVVLRTIRQHRVTHVTLVEPQVVQLVDDDRFTATEIATIVAITHVGADAAASLKARLLACLGRDILVHAYGSSEVGVVSALAAPDYSRQHPGPLASSGKPLPGVGVRIVDDDGRNCRTGELGSIVVRTPAQAQGYSVGPASSGFLADGWFDTHDMGTLDADGYLRIRGRRADLRIVEGRHVFPLDLQEAFCALPDVCYAVAIAAPNPYQGFGVALVLAETSANTIDALSTAVRDEAGSHLVPSVAVVVSTIPTTEQGKPDRRALSAMLWPEWADVSGSRSG